MNAQLAFDTRRLEPRDPRETIEDALRWIDANPDPWRSIVRMAHADAELYGRVRVKRYVEDLRQESRSLTQTRPGAKLPNGLTPAFGRILAAWYPEIAPCVPLAHSKLDGCVIPGVPRP